ncbi:DUF362 domain-containing protein [Methanobacterium sp.]|uniref:DUF362 domain-containing protein n=1 Tax=Methanobacterium sp. TaxID=2164 RepID=UPI003D65622A
MNPNDFCRKNIPLNSDIDNKKTDSQGSPVCGAKMDASKAYAEIPELLQKVINLDDEAAWATIVKKIDYIYDHIDYSLVSLDKETDFISKLQSEIQSGKKLLFKPNLVGPQVIDPDTHGEDLGAPICTDWSMIAALMRWFHDKLNIDYYQMALGEASTSALLVGASYSLNSEKTVTTEAVFEGRCGDFYGGWGFYFVRKYLKEHHPSSHVDDPMNGYEDSIKGRYFAPGKAHDRLMVYDLNKIDEDPFRGRTVSVPGGENFKDITLHKVIIGGDPQNADDIKDYPGCVLINVPKMKIHAQDLITNAIKNLGIGLYPTQCASSSESNYSWEYAMPATENPTFKGKLPHMPWIAEIDEDTNLPIMDENGAYIVTKTAGMKGTQADVIKAVQNQGVFMMHISDSVNMINLSHNPEGIAVRIPEGYIWSSLDCVALDLLCARYCFKTVPMSEGMRLKEENNWNTEFVHHVPVARIDGKNIITEEGLDSPLFRYNLYEYAEKRGIGQQKYYVTGWDSVTSTPLTSIAGHLGRIDNEKFVELMTKTMYYNPSCMLWDMQKTILSYAEAHDTLTGTSIFKEFIDSFDENHDGIIDYDENGRKGIWTPGFSIMSYALDIMITEDFGALKGPFYQNANFYLKNGNENWNPHGHNFAQEYVLMGIANMAYEMSKSKIQSEDPFIQGMSWGNGLWPSWELAKHAMIFSSIYGALSLDKINIGSLYGLAFSYADKTGNNGLYTGSVDQRESDPEALNAYFNAISKGADLLDFILYVPIGLGNMDNIKIPNVEETNDPSKIFTAHFNQGQEVW